MREWGSMCACAESVRACVHKCVQACLYVCLCMDARVRVYENEVHVLVAENNIPISMDGTLDGRFLIPEPAGDAPPL